MRASHDTNVFKGVKYKLATAAFWEFVWFELIFVDVLLPVVSVSYRSLAFICFIKASNYKPTSGFRFRS